MGRKHNRFEVKCLLEDEQTVQYYGFNVLREARRNKHIVVFKLNGFEFESFMSNLHEHKIDQRKLIVWRKVAGNGYRFKQTDNQRTYEHNHIRK
jgi:hypothetical protein